MNLKGVSVEHKVFGIGKIKKQKDDHIIITFGDSDKKFLYNETFKNFFTVLDDKADLSIGMDIENKMASLEEESN